MAFVISFQIDDIYPWMQIGEKNECGFPQQSNDKLLTLSKIGICSFSALFER